FLFYHRLADRDLWSSHEARAAQNSQRMLDDREWLLPRLFDGHLDMQKPPLYYWLVAAIGGLQGGSVNAWAVRLPAAFSATFVVFSVWWTLYRRGRPLAGIIAALILATSHHFTWLARTGRIDMVLSFTVAAAILIHAFWQRGHVLAYLMIAAGLLLKGPIGLVLPVAAIVIDSGVKWKLRSREFPKTSPEGAAVSCQGRQPLETSVRKDQPRRGEETITLPGLLKRRTHSSGVRSSLLTFAPSGLAKASASLLWGVPLALLLAAPWFLLANQRTHGQFFRVFFVHHNIDRALGTSEDLAVHPWWFYGLRWLVDILPWSPFLLFGGFWFIRSKLWRYDGEARVGFVWMLAVTLVLSCAQFKRADYLLPAYPGFAIFLGCLAERTWNIVNLRLRRTAAFGFAGVLAAVVGFWLFIVHVQIPRNESFHEQQTFAREIRRQAPAPQTVLFFRVEAHALAFHLGRPLNTFLEWENLDVWAGRPGVHYIVMSPQSAAEWPEHVHSGTLEEVCRNTDWSGGRHEKPLVLMRTRPKAELHAASRQ
ncbi:MAG TPA: glycosyltransferase family 39 protein, partial [Gemmataceae bacterium]|nr:glycosyltransferase family 39 protein [Gemmataceae bacterium]